MPESAEIVQRERGDALSTIVGTGDTRAMLEQVERNVKDVIEVARARGFVQKYGGSQHEFFGFPAWSLLAMTYGLVPFVEWTRPVDNGWEARAVVKTRDGSEVAAAEAMCTKAETNRRNADPHTLRAMAQTRAMRNALRSCLGAALVLSGFDFADPEGPATKAQVGVLHQLEREIGMSHDEGHATAGVDSYKDLNREDAAALIDRWTAMRDELQGQESGDGSPPKEDSGGSPAPSDVNPSATGGRADTSVDEDASGEGTDDRLGEGRTTVPEPEASSENEPATAEGWARAPHDMSRVAAIKLAKKLIDTKRMPGPVPKTQGEFTKGQLAEVAGAYRDGERG